jgi:hypothetical protein
VPSVRDVRLAIRRAIIEMSGSSCVPSTCEWLARICSINVEPERGKPTMKIGSRCLAAPPARSAKNSRREQPLRTLDVAAFLSAS